MFAASEPIFIYTGRKVGNKREEIERCRTGRTNGQTDPFYSDTSKLILNTEPFTRQVAIFMEAAFFLLILLSIAYYGTCGFCVRWFEKARLGKTETAEGVSLLIPVCGVDMGARENWISFCRQNYAEYEVLFGVKDTDDPAVPIIKEMIREIRAGRLTTKARRVRLHFCTKVFGSNHQISNLTHLLRIAKYERIVFADSDIRVTPEYLDKVTAHLSDPAVGVVTCGYLDFDPKSMGAALAAFGRCIDFIPGVLIARKLDGGLRFAIGPTIVTRKSVIDEIGGLGTLHNRIGSDYHIGKMATDAGYRVVLSEYLLQNDCGRETLRDVFRRELRWARTIRSNRGYQYYGMGICHATVYCIPFLWITGFQFWAIGIGVTAYAARIAQALISIKSLNAPNLLRWIWVLPIRDGMTFAVWLGGCFGSCVHWRGRKLQIGMRGIILGNKDRTFFQHHDTKS